MKNNYVNRDQEREKSGREIFYCKKCLMPNTRPRVTFDALGVCNACNHAAEKWDSVNWDARRKEFDDLLNAYRSKNGNWDCIVPWSGGKDSSYVAYRLKFEFKMNPLLVTFSPQVPTEVGNHNREALIQCGFDHLFFRPDQRVHRRLSKRFFIERGNQKVAWDAGINTIPVKFAVKLGIPLIFYAEHGESEYGGKILHEDAKKIRDFTEVIEHQIGDDPRNWVDEEISAKDLNPYIYPDIDEVSKVGIKAFYFGYFFKWSSYENYLYVKDKFDFHTCPAGRTEGTFTDFDSLDDKSDNLYYYLQYIKFGFGRVVRDASRMIQNRQLTRERGLELSRKYDHEFPALYLQDMLQYLQLSEREFLEIVDKHRNPEIWKNENGEWKLRYPLV
ncbi:MAG: N-acetyl sugar amidotransferase [Candidatus Omnitrophica bacterium]|nr:N-acetyl sugar amidotransferase [Candidatus Omnitrophota bacterium]MDD5660338.1 N-acetyl sugar amidotransferase [Candidatus Omnitrophota bacterium]